MVIYTTKHIGQNIPIFSSLFRPLSLSNCEYRSNREGNKEAKNSPKRITKTRKLVVVEYTPLSWRNSYIHSTIPRNFHRLGFAYEFMCTMARQAENWGEDSVEKFRPSRVQG